MESTNSLWATIKKSKFLRFCLTGGLNTVVDFAVYTSLIAFFDINIYVAQVCGYSVGIVNSYVINRSWTFKTKGKFFGKELYAFLAVNLTILLMSLWLMRYLTEAFALHYIIVKLITVIFTVGVGFVMNRFLVFKSK